ARSRRRGSGRTTLTRSWPGRPSTLTGGAGGHSGRHATEALSEVLREPEVPVRTDGDASRPAVRTRDIESGDHSLGRDSPDLPQKVLGEPQIPVGAGGDVIGAGGAA